MARPDLLALEAEDLVVLSNRGIVKRAQAELDGGSLTFEVAEDAGSVTVRWSDDVECRLPAGKTLADGQCSCPATTLCRHLVRSVLAYQQAARAPAAGEPAEEDEAAPAPPEPWDPGAIPDEELERRFRKADLARARRQFDEGQVMELVRSVRPSARIHTLSLNLRFLVRGDLNYTHCDCAEPNPCSHVPLAVWAFRMLAPEQAGGVVSTHKETLPVPAPLLDDVEAALLALAAPGVSTAPPPLIDRFRRLETRLRDEALVWPAEIVAELVQQVEAYLAHDARFAPRRVAELAAELCIRLDAIRADTGAVPQLFIRGSRLDRTTDVGQARLVGLGCGAELRRGGVEISAYLQDTDAGTVVAISRDYTDPPKDDPSPPREFSGLAQFAVFKGVSLAALGAGQLLIKGGKRTPAGRFLPGRAQAALNPQSFQWESLRPPVLVDDLAELAARLAAQPPASLQPRRVAANLAVCAVAGVDAVEFSDVEQTVYALVRDAAGTQALLVHPYTSRSREGTEALIARLKGQPDTLRFVAGQARLAGGGVVLSPLSLIFQDGSTRTMLQPWIDRAAASTGAAVEPSAGGPSAGPTDPAGEFPDQLLDAVGEQWLLGLQRADERTAGHWRELAERGAALGFERLLRPVARLADTLDEKRHTLRWEAEPAARALLEIGLLAHLAHDQAA